MAFLIPILILVRNIKNCISNVFNMYVTPSEVYNYFIKDSINRLLGIDSKELNADIKLLSMNSLII